MTWILVLMMLPLAAFLYWAGFYATKQMRVKKNKMREEQARKNLERQRLELAAEAENKTP